MWVKSRLKPGANCLRPFVTIEGGNIILAGVLSPQLQREVTTLQYSNTPILQNSNSLLLRTY